MYRGLQSYYTGRMQKDAPIIKKENVRTLGKLENWTVGSYFSSNPIIKIAILSSSTHGLRVLVKHTTLSPNESSSKLLSFGDFHKNSVSMPTISSLIGT